MKPILECSPHVLPTSAALRRPFFPFSSTFLSPIHAVPVRSPSPKLTAGWPRGVGKVHNTRLAGLAGQGWRRGPSPPRREAAGELRAGMGPSTLAVPCRGADWSEAARAQAAGKARMPDNRCAQVLAQLVRPATSESRTNSTASELQRPATSMASTTSRHRWARMSSG